MSLCLDTQAWLGNTIKWRKVMEKYVKKLIFLLMFMNSWSVVDAATNSGHEAAAVENMPDREEVAAAAVENTRDHEEVTVYIRELWPFLGRPTSRERALWLEREMRTWQWEYKDGFIRPSGVLIPSSLIDIVQFGFVDSVKKLLDRGADVNSVSDNGQTPLMAACTKGAANVVKQLLARGANVFACDKKGYTALAYAVQHNHTEIVKLLIVACLDGIAAQESNAYRAVDEESILFGSAFAGLEKTEEMGRIIKDTQEACRRNWTLEQLLPTGIVSACLPVEAVEQLVCAYIGDASTGGIENEVIALRKGLAGRKEEERKYMVVLAAARTVIEERLVAKATPARIRERRDRAAAAEGVVAVSDASCGVCSLM